MEEARTARAIARIEAAVDRIEAALRHLDANTGDRQLAERHEALKREAAAALAGIDRVIASLEQ